MAVYVRQRLLTMIPMLIGIMLISFLIMNLAPGDPVYAYIDPDSHIEDEATLEAIRRSLGLDQPLPIRFGIWVMDVLRGRLGYSLVSRKPVVNEIQSRVFNSVLLTSVSLFCSLAIGTVVGVHSALNQYSLSDYVATVLSFIGLSLPNFWFAIMLILLFSVRLGWLPSVGMTSLDAAPGLVYHLLDVARHMVMPVMVLALSSTAGWVRYMRSSMLEVIRQDYIRTARSKGLRETVVIYRHALRNALIPIVTLLGLSIPGLISGSFIVESVFGWPGMGRLGVNAVFSRDYQIIMAVTLFASVLVMMGNFIADIMYVVVDPRIRYQ